MRNFVVFLELYYLEKDGVWEPIIFKATDQTEDEREYVIFSVDELGTFVFAKRVKEKTTKT